MKVSLLFLGAVLWLLPMANAGYAPVVLLSVEPPNPQVPAGCDPTFRDAMTKTIASQWLQCQQIGKTEPSYCQRELFDLCIRAAREVASQARKTCVEIASGGNETMGARGTVSSQLSGDRSSGSVNAKAGQKMKAYIAILKTNKAALEQQRALQAKAAKAHFCKDSSRSKIYQQLEQRLDGTTNAAATFIDDLSGVKKRTLEQLGNLEGEVNNRGALLGNGQTREAPKITSPKVTNFSPRMEPLLKLSLGPAKLIGYGNGGQSPMGSRSGVNPPDEGFFQRGPGGGGQWIQGGTAGLGMIASEAARTEPAFADPPPRDRWETGNVLTENPPVLTASDKAGASPGSNLFREYGLLVDIAFIDKELLTIENAFKMMPECTRAMLRRGVFALVGMPEAGKAGRCHYGQMKMTGGNSAYWVKLNPFHACGGQEITPDMVVHELYHVVGFSNNSCLSDTFQKKIAAALNVGEHPRNSTSVFCPVSPYGATNINEDFAQAGVQAHFSSGGVDGQVNSAACANTKRSIFRELVGRCQCGQ